MNRNIRLIISLLSLSCLMFMSCGDEESFDFYGDGENIVYIKPLENTVNGFNKVLLAINKTPLAVIKGTIKLPVFSTLPAKGDVNISFSVDNSLAESYNAKNKTSYKTIPAEAVDIKNNGLKIPSNATTSEGIVEISIHDNAIANLTEKEYLIPIRIDKVIGNAVISSNRNIFYTLVSISVDQDNIWDTAIDESSRGNLLTIDRTSWTVTPVNSEFQGTINNMFDGVEYSNVGYKVNSYDDNTGFTMDMKKEYSNISAIRQHFYSGGYSITSSDIYTSLDNETWTYQGHFNNSVEVANICFYVPVKARYIKTVVRKISRSVYIRELNIYVNN